ncbi:tRNA (guanosine(46)-N7)-methyltransferase TrmB [Savagea sp. SN6]|uniref:tRNA (guanine-N(7)-)-methyltransferase n=1 Tax=Savagea serpentis TaxID=2785297 RepID=A0A8J7KDA4_9BACL|nr:tRNA (guanosine(46)-N7)-methyltransferase TrmB [Savagea serpentis]MBF4499796.1 tRNA (guanosine(46)-N7)-methyltransferase TrmB [Savagea serpentis]
MRLRHKPWALDYLQENDHIAKLQPEQLKGKWAEEFGNDRPIHIEVGTGKGQFIANMAKNNPDINYIGIEHFDNVVVSAVEKAIELGAPSNLRLIRGNAEKLEEMFDKGEVALVYLNFSDPWPKARHEKRRLTFKTFLTRYRNVMPQGGEIHFKTDNRGLFEYSLVSMTNYGMQLLDVSLDLHADDVLDNVMTEYEEKFSAKGHPIYRLEAKYQ